MPTGNMPTGVSAPLEEYLSTMYSPDREWIDGELLERNMGELDHAGMQSLITLALGPQRSRTGTHVFVECRLQVAATRFVIPDIAVITYKAKGRILQTPPFLCIEIVSPEDRLSRMEAKIEDYLAFGVKYVWLVDPRRKQAWTYTNSGRLESKGSLTTESPELTLNLQELFEELDEQIEP